MNDQLAMGMGRKVNPVLVAQVNQAFYTKNPKAPQPLEQQTPRGRKWTAEWVAAYRDAERAAEGLGPIPVYQPAPDLRGYYDLGGDRKTAAAFALYCPGNTNIGGLAGDYAGRCKQVSQALKVAAERLKRIGDPRDTLPVFVAPEAYFQKPADSRGPVQYNRLEFSGAIQLLQSLSRDTYPDMLIIPGSFAWYEPAAKSPKDDRYKKYEYHPKEHRPREMWELVHNTAPVFFGGQVYFYTKRSAAGNIAYPGQLYNLPPTPGPQNKTGGFFAACGLTFGLRICADDADSLRDYRATFPGGKGVDFHILIANGQGVDRNTSAVRGGGCIVRVDSEPGSWQKRCTVRQASHRLDHAGDRDTDLLLVDADLPLAVTSSGITPG